MFVPSPYRSAYLPRTPREKSYSEVVRVGRTVRGIGEGVFRGLSTYPSLSKAGGGNGGWGYGGGGCLIL